MADSSAAEEIGEEQQLLGGGGNGGGGSNKGGIRTLPFIIANEGLENCASKGLNSNLTRYLMVEYGMSAVQTSNLFSYWASLNGLTPVIGAFLADSCVGRYRMIAMGTISSSLGMALLWLTAAIPQARPYSDKSTAHCSSPTAVQLFVLCCCFILMSIGAGGIESSCLAFGADQLTNKNAGLLESFFGWYYVSTLVGALFGMIVIVYIQDNFGWNLGFGIPVILMLFSILSFFLASSFYVKVEPSASFFNSLFQVVVASYRKRHVRLPSKSSYELYHHSAASTRQKPSDKLRFLNKACVILNPEEETTSNPWTLCTVEQVEDFKSIINVIPIWSVGILFSVSFNQITLPYLQVSSMDRRITPNFQVPTGSFTMFLLICIGLWIFFYDRILVPLATKIARKPTRLKPLQKIGLGIVMSCISTASMAVVEIKRRAKAVEQGFSDDPHAVVNMSAFWLLPHYVFGGIADACFMIGQNEFFYSELPKSMSSVAIALPSLSMSVGSLVASFLLTAVDDLTKSEEGESWVSSNINIAHYDYYFFLISGLCFVDFIYFVVCSKRYSSQKGEEDVSLFYSNNED